MKEFLVNVSSNRLSELYQRNAALMGFTFHNVKTDMEVGDWRELRKCPLHMQTDREYIITIIINFFIHSFILK